MRTLCLTVLAGLAALPLGARAAVTEGNFQVVSAADLASVCGVQAGDRLYTAAKNFCEGFTVGTYRVLAQEEVAGGLKTICLPEPAPSRDATVDAYLSYVGGLKAPEKMPAEDSVLQFLQHQYPCHSTKQHK